MSARLAGPLAALFAVTASAEPGWLSARGRVVDASRLELYLGTRSVGAGLTVADRREPDPTGPNPRAWVGELMWNLPDRVAEGRLGRLFQINQAGFATASAFLGGSAIVVPEGLVDLGLGPTGALTLSLGGRVFSVELGLQSGVDFFARGGTRLPQRALLGLEFRVLDFTLSAMARLGVDLEPGRNFVGRGEMMVALGWVGLH